MNNLNKVNKCISSNDIKNIVYWEYKLIDINTWEIIEPEIESSKYKLKLSNNKEFMKKWTDRKLNIAIKSNLTLLEKEILLDIYDYIDISNIINFKLLSNDFKYSPSKISKVKKRLSDNKIIKKVDWLYYLSPLLWIKTKEISQELINIFADSFKYYWVTIK